MAKVRLLDPTDSKRKLDRYELIGELASGGMATVFLGRLGGVGGFQRFVAIKRLHPHLAAEQEFIEMFLDEARLAAGIHHPHVVPILEVGESESGYYLVMEYIEGDTVARLMARSLAMAKPIPRPVLVRIVLDSLNGLHAAHELCDTDGAPVHLVHRDVSPQNILVGVDGCSRITDFGVAHAASRLSNTRADKLKGKLAYMSPEQARAGEVDRRADVFAMGIILWEVLATKRLFKAEHEAITLQKVTVDPIPRLMAVAPSIHPAFDQVCAKALERDPARRYQSAAEMAESLERAARTAASTSPTDLGVASPREVASYVQGALGEDIAAQRESVRAWLAHSEPSLPRTSITALRAGEALGLRPPVDVTVRVPLDRPSSAPAPQSRPGHSGPPSSAPATALGLGSAPPPRAAPIAATPMPATTPSPGTQPRGASGAPGSNPPPGAGRRVGVTQAALEAAIAEAGELAPHEGVADDEDENETLLMDRDSGAAMKALGLLPLAAPVVVAPPATPSVPPKPHFDEVSASASLEALAVSHRPTRRAPQVVALVLGIALAVGALAVWQKLQPASVAPTPTTKEPDRPAQGAPPAATPAPSAQPAPGAQPAPSAQPAASAQPSAVETAAAATSAAPTPVVKGPLPVSPGGKGKPKPAETAAPVKPAEPPSKPPPDLPPSTGGGDEANPYR